MEDNEDAESAKSVEKLGKLQFSLDYDFQKGEVSRRRSELNGHKNNFQFEFIEYFEFMHINS